MRWVHVLLASVLLLGTAGCWSRRELTEVSFAGMMGIDWVGGQYQLTVDILSPARPAGGGGGGGEQERVWTVSATAPALDEAFGRLDQVLSRSLTLAHVRSVMFGEAMARRGIGAPIDYLLRSVEVRPTAWIGVTNGLARDLLQARPRQEAGPANGPAGYHDVAQRRSSITPARRLVEVANVLQEEGVDLTLPLFRRGNREAPTPDFSQEPSPDTANEIIYGGAGVFKGDGLVAWLSPTGTRGQLWAIGRVVHGTVSAPCDGPEGRAVFRLRNTHGRVQVRTQGGRLRGEIRVVVEADLNDLGCPQLQIGPWDVTPLERLLVRLVETEVREALEAVRATGADFLALGQSLFRRAPREYHRYQPNWAERLAEMPVTINVQARVVRLGQINERFRWEESR